MTDPTKMYNLSLLLRADQFIIGKKEHFSNNVESDILSNVKYNAVPLTLAYCVLAHSVLKLHCILYFLCILRT